ncbi:MAG: hypothetical protein ACJ72R_15810 [Nitrososphaeraceae archaeon]
MISESSSQDMSVPFDLMILRDIFQQNLITSDKLHIAWDYPRGKVVLAV